MSIVTRQMAEKAAQAMGVTLLSLDEAVIKDRYRVLAKQHHPDKGGCMDDFVQLDRSKEILLRWLARPKTEPADKSISSDKCPMCKGSGKRTLRRGFRTMTMVCGTCRGMGERVQPDKVEE